MVQVPGYDDGEGITIDFADNMYICGVTGGTPVKKFVKKYNSTGNELWTYTSGGEGSTGTFYDQVLDEFNNTYACGIHTSSGDDAAVIYKIDNGGNHIWARSWELFCYDDTVYNDFLNIITYYLVNELTRSNYISEIAK